MGKKFLGIIIKQAATSQPRNISVTARYMADLAHEGHKVPSDEHGPMSGAMNCISNDRRGQLREIEHTLRLHGNLKSTQAASHQILSYPEGFIPTRVQIERDISILLKKYGMSDHALVWDCHSNTNNFHVHVLLSRVALAPNADGKYEIANDGLVQKKCIEKDASGNILRERMLTDWAGCRQSAISEIGEAYGWGVPVNVRMTPDGKPRDRVTPKDRQSDKTKAGEAKTGKKSQERQLAEFMKEVFVQAAIRAAAGENFWSVADRLFAEKAIEMVINVESGKVKGGFIVGPDGRRCKFTRAGKGYSAPILAKKYGMPKEEHAACVNEYSLIPFEYADAPLDSGPRKPLAAAAREIFDQKLGEADTEILLRDEGISLAWETGTDKKTGRQFEYGKLSRDGESPISLRALGTDEKGKTLYSKASLEKQYQAADARAAKAVTQPIKPVTQPAVTQPVEASPSQDEIRLIKNRKVNDLTMLAVVAYVIKIKKELQNVKTDSHKVDRIKHVGGEVSQTEPVLQM